MTAALLLAAAVLAYKFVLQPTAKTPGLFEVIIDVVVGLSAIGIFIYVVIRLLVSGAW